MSMTMLTNKIWGTYPNLAKPKSRGFLWAVDLIFETSALYALDSGDNDQYIISEIDYKI